MGLKLKTVILECNHIHQLSSFYSDFLGWPIVFKEENFIRLQSPESDMGIAVQYAEDYVAPVWPSESEKQQMMVHLDFGVKDKKELAEWVDRAIKSGAKLAQMQYGDGEWITMIDPAGHPFCIVVWD
ncbi:Catechol 2,3-dioxygenase [Lachnospiraceae bacterium NLAE-zl-G231]|nr:Catechol 2,3-dioxygenase [Lachnospiraceae bacterium NLAE-zl-G231]